MSCTEWHYYKQNINEATITFIFNRVYIPSETEMMVFHLMVLHILEQNQRRPWVLVLELDLNSVSAFDRLWVISDSHLTFFWALGSLLVEKYSK